MVKWKGLKKRIPNRIQVGRNEFYDILWVDSFPKDENQFGQTDFTFKQIILNKNQSDRELVHTYFHELTHLFAEICGVPLTEKNVCDLEKSAYYILKANNLFLTKPARKKNLKSKK